MIPPDAPGPIVPDEPPKHQGDEPARWTSTDKRDISGRLVGLVVLFLALVAVIALVIVVHNQWMVITSAGTFVAVVLGAWRRGWGDRGPDDLGGR